MILSVLEITSKLVLICDESVCYIVVFYMFQNSQLIWLEIIPGMN